MMGRVRSRSRKDWPPHMYACRDGFKYRHPVTRKDTWMGRDKAKAFAAARKLNALLIPSNDLVNRVVQGRHTVKQAITLLRADYIPARKWAPKTAEVYESVIRRIEAGIGSRELDNYTVKDCAEFIRAVTASDRSRQQFRLVLSWIFAGAVQEGWMDENPAEQTRKITHTRKRDRLTLPAYQAIHAQAPGWLQNAMDLSLLTLLRREDVASLRFADARDGALWVVPSKTAKTSGVRLRIAIGAELERVLARSRDNVASPFVVHRLPGKARPQEVRAKGRTHHTQVLPEQVSRAFDKAREAAGIVSEHPPTFHEIRSLGGSLLQDAGVSLADVQALMGHASEAMTKHYLEGHEVPWQAVTTGIKLPRQP